MCCNCDQPDWPMPPVPSKAVRKRTCVRRSADRCCALNESVVNVASAQVDVAPWIVWSVCNILPRIADCSCSCISLLSTERLFPSQCRGSIRLRRITMLSPRRLPAAAAVWQRRSRQVRRCCTAAFCDSLNCCSHALSSPVISLRPPTSRRAHTKPCIAIGFLAHCAALFAPPQRWRASSHHCKPTIGMSSAATGSCVLLTAVCVSALSVILVCCKCVAKS